MKNKKQHFGFTLIELLITLAIISILACISYPTYTRHLIKVRRSNIVIALFDATARLEQYYAKNNSYTGADINNLGIKDETFKNFYTLKITTTANSYNLQATPLGIQEKSDIECEILSMDQNGNKSISGIGKIEDCW